MTDSLDPGTNVVGRRLPSNPPTSQREGDCVSMGAMLFDSDVPDSAFAKEKGALVHISQPLAAVLSQLEMFSG